MIKPLKFNVYNNLLNKISRVMLTTLVVEVKNSSLHGKQQFLIFYKIESTIFYIFF